MAKRKQEEDWFTCGNCGTTLPMSAKVCRECGADEEHGFSLESHQGLGLNLPDEIEAEELPQKGIRTKGIRWWLWITIILIVLAFAIVFILSPIRWGTH